MFLSFFKRLLCISCVFYSLTAHTQKQHLLSDEALAEKIYLQLDSESYVHTASIWFKAVVVNAVSHRPTNRSRILYVELINPFQEVIQQKKLRIKAGVTSNFFDLNSSYPGGKYQIRAYTQRNLNFESEFIFTL